MRRLRARLNGLEAHSHSTLAKGDVALLALQDLIADLADGVDITISVPSTGIPIIDALGGKLSFTIRIDPKE